MCYGTALCHSFGDVKLQSKLYSTVPKFEFEEQLIVSVVFGCYMLDSILPYIYVSHIP